MKTLRLTLTCLTLTTLLAACGGSKKSPKTCEVGVNQSACALDVREVSTWGETFTTSESDPKTRHTVPGSERQISVAYEFVPGAPARWRRTITVDQRNESLAMFQEGAVREITGNLLHLVVTRSSCDEDAPALAEPQQIYYRRHAGTLQLDTQPIAPPTKSKFLFDGIFTDLVGKAIGTMLRTGLETAFTFGSVRTYLTSNHGSLSARATDVRALARAEYVCFNGLGSGYAASKHLPSW